MKKLFNWLNESIYTNPLSPACKMCSHGSKMVLLITGLCPANCFCCPLSAKKLGKDRVFADEWELKNENDTEKLLLEAEYIEATGAGITGGDPLVVWKRTKKYITLLKDKFGYDNSEKTLRNNIPEIRRKYDLRDNNTTQSKEIDAISKLLNEKQKLLDHNRIIRKAIRSHNRSYTILEELFNDLLGRIREIDVDYKMSKIDEINDKETIITISDAHFGETIFKSDTLGINSCAFDVLSKRLQKYADKIKEMLTRHVSNITVALMGDLINSDRRLDELITNDGCVAEAFIKSLQILTPFLIDLRSSFNIKVASVLGNESRMDLTIPMKDPINNFDFLIHKMLSELFVDKSDIKFLDIERNYEKLINVLGANILLTHGHTKLSWSDAVKKYNKIGTILHYMITAHLHTVSIKEQTSQSASLSGNNFYGAFGINDLADASQTVYLVEKEDDGVTSRTTVSPMIINLQNVYGYSGYNFQNDVCKMR